MKLDLRPSAEQLIVALAGVSNEQLDSPTPNEKMPMAALLDHLMNLSVEFTDAANKAVPSENGVGAQPPSADHLDPLWRDTLPQRLHNLVKAWRDPQAWQGTTQAGGATMPADRMGVVAVAELVLHGWDLAKASSQPFDVDEAAAGAVLAFATEIQQGDEASRQGLYGPPVPIPEDASTLERALGMAGRNPAWAPPGR